MTSDNSNNKPSKAEVSSIAAEFYQEYKTGPSMRALINLIKINPSYQTVDSVYLMELFPGGLPEIYDNANIPRDARCL